MASRFPSIYNKVKLKARKGHDMKWSCDKHAEPIAFQCKKHKINICHRCATKDHGQKPCELEDIEDVILEMRRKLEDTQSKIAPAKKRLKTLRSKLESGEASASNYLQSVSDDVNACNRKMNSVKDKEQDDIRLINEEADEEIRIINEKRETRIKACKKEAEKQQQISKDIQAKLLSEIKKIDSAVRKQIEDLKSKNQHEINTMDNLDSKIERIKQNDKTLVNETPQLIASLDESLSSNVHQEVADFLDRIEREVQRVKFVDCEVGGEHYGRIDGYIGKWELVKSFDIPSIVNEPLVNGLISDDEICVSDTVDRISYVTHISTEHTQKVIEGDHNMYVTSCAPVDSNVIVCSKWRGNGSDDIILCDRRWKVITDLIFPTTLSEYNAVYVDVDMNGMILAARDCHSDIHFIYPAYDFSYIKVMSKKVWGRIQALSSGDIAVQTSMREFTVITQSGEEKAVIHCDEWKDSRFCVDKLTDTLYITYQDTERNVYIVDQVSCDGNIQARRIVEYKLSDRSPYISPCLVTPSGNLVVCDGDKLMMYKKSFIL